MISLTTNQILSLARAKLLESTTELLPDATLLIYANLSQDEIAKRTFTNDKITSDTITFTNGTGTLPATFGTAYGDAVDASGLFYKEVNIEDFAKETEDRMFTIEAGEIKCYPATTTSLLVKFWPTYAALTSAVNPSIDPYFSELIVYGIMYRAYEDLQDPELSKYYREKFEAELVAKIANESNYQENNQHGEMFSYTSLI